MIHASRTTFQELPNGDLTCTITIPAAERAAFFGSSDAVVCLTLAGQPIPAPAPVVEETFAEDFSVQLQADSADDKPPTQGIGVDGFDTAKVVEAVTSGGAQWDHPAAPHLKDMYKHPPFQRWAMQRLNADAFAAPMECATRLIIKATKGRPIDVALSSLGRKMDAYMAWAKDENLPVWPEKTA